MRHQHIAKKAGKARTSSSIFSREGSDFFFSSASERSEPFFTSNTVQPKLTIGAPNDKYEQQADRVADTVMRMPDKRAQMQPDEKEEELLQTQPMEQEEELHAKSELLLQPKCAACQQEEQLQQKSQHRPSKGTSAGESLSRRLKSSKGRGSPLPERIRTEMGQKIGADFSAVHIHTDAKAAGMNRQLGARAFTHGKDIYFNSGQYSPASPRGKHLLAHELTHVIQQSGGSFSPIISMQREFKPGRPEHNHTPVGWPKIRWQAMKNCDPFSKRGRIECVCAASNYPIDALTAALAGKMYNAPLARKHLLHYMWGGGGQYNENVNVENLIKRDLAVRAKFAAAISSSHRGDIPIWQGDYSVEDFRLAFGGIDRVDYEVNAKKGTVDIWFMDRYDFHPAGFGYANKGTGDLSPPGRETNCIHAAAVESKAWGAADYWMKGEATFPLSLFKSRKVEPHPGTY